MKFSLIYQVEALHSFLAYFKYIAFQVKVTSIEKYIFVNKFSRQSFTGRTAVFLASPNPFSAFFFLINKSVSNRLLIPVQWLSRDYQKLKS